MGKAEVESKITKLEQKVSSLHNLGGGVQKLKNLQTTAN